jgi:hypothetical protein
MKIANKKIAFPNFGTVAASAKPSQLSAMV